MILYFPHSPILEKLFSRRSSSPMLVQKLVSHPSGGQYVHLHTRVHKDLWTSIIHRLRHVPERSLNFYPTNRHDQKHLKHFLRFLLKSKHLIQGWCFPRRVLSANITHRSKALWDLFPTHKPEETHFKYYLIKADTSFKLH